MNTKSNMKKKLAILILLCLIL